MECTPPQTIAKTQTGLHEMASEVGSRNEGGKCNLSVNGMDLFALINRYCMEVLINALGQFTSHQRTSMNTMKTCDIGIDLNNT